MTPETPDPIAEPYDPADPDAEEQRPKRSLWGLVLTILGIIAIILLLLLLRDCGGADSGASDDGDKVIVRVSGLEPVDGVISIWITQDADINEVLAAAEVRSTNILDMGDGRYVVETGRGSEAKVIAAIKRTAGVNDAGRVFER
ncbi:MAG: hypothetical protein U1E26_11560 [Coriobacteriia bacterium]|nr:hypothetical protein [Coriobacteriia bacterium]